MMLWGTRHDLKVKIVDSAVIVQYIRGGFRLRVAATPDE